MSDIEYNDFSDSNSDGESLNEYKKTQPFKKKPTISSYEEEDNDEDNINEIDEDIEDENNIETDDFEDENKNDGVQEDIDNNDEEDTYEDIDDDTDKDEYEDGDDDEDEDDDDDEDADSNTFTGGAKINKNKKSKEEKKNNIKLDFENNEDTYYDDEDDQDDNYLQKFDKEITKDYVMNFHPECLNHNYDEIKALSKVTKDEFNIIIDPLHKTIPFLTKYEKTRILGQRAKQIECGAKPLVKVPENIIDSYVIAELELEQKAIPFIIRRPIPSGGSEYWNLKDLEIISF